MLEIYFKNGSKKVIDWGTLRPLLTQGLMKEREKRKYNFLSLREMRTEYDWLQYCAFESKNRNISAIALS